MSDFAKHREKIEQAFARGRNMIPPGSWGEFRKEIGQTDLATLKKQQASDVADLHALTLLVLRQGVEGKHAEYAGFLLEAIKIRDHRLVELGESATDVRL